MGLLNKVEHSQKEREREKEVAKKHFKFLIKPIIIIREMQIYTIIIIKKTTVENSIHNDPGKDILIHR